MTTDADMPALPEPDGYFYEVDSYFGVHRQFDLMPYNGVRPQRTVGYFTADTVRAAIAADRERAVRTALAELERVAIGAVYHVGAANYAEREREALQWVRKAADAARAALAEQPASVAVARPLEWERDSYGQLSDAHHGFSILLEEGDEEPYSASWGESDAAQFATLEEAQAWCQQQIDDWVARHVVLASSPQPPTRQEGSCAT